MRNDLERMIRTGIDDCLSGVEGGLEGRVLARIRRERRGPARLTVAMAAVMILVLLTAAGLAVGTLTGWFRVEQQQVGAMRSCVSDGETLYLLTSEGLHTWQPGQDAPGVRLSAEGLYEAGLSPEGELTLMDGKPALLHPSTRTLWRIDGAGLQPLADYRGTVMDDEGLRIAAVACAGETLLIRAVPEEGHEEDAQLLRWHLPTGSLERLPLTGVVELCALDDSHALAIRRDLSAREEHLIRIDAAQGSIAETLFTGPVQGLEGLMAHPGTGQIIAVAGGAPSLWNGSGWTAMQGYGLSVHADAYAIVGDGLAAVSYNELQVIPLLPENSLTTLRIRGFMPLNNEDDAFQQEMPGIAVQRAKDPALNAAAIRQAVAGGDTTDLFHVYLNQDTAELFRDGTLAALPLSPVLTEDARAMLPAFQEGLYVDGRLYAVPSGVSVMVWESGETVPATFGELLEAQAYVAPHWADTGWTKADYADHLLTAMILAGGTETVDFRSPALGEALTALREARIPTEARAGCPVITTDATVDLHGRPADPGQSASVLWQLPCAVDGGQLPVVPARMTVYVLNPNAANPELALRFLEQIAARRQPGQEALLKPMTAEPALHPAVEAQIGQMTEEQQAMGGGSEADEATPAGRAEAIKAAPDSWAVEETRLQIYRERIAPCVRLPLHPLLSKQSRASGGAYDRMLEAVLACADGEGTLEDCLQKLEAAAAEAVEASGTAGGAGVD